MWESFLSNTPAAMFVIQETATVFILQWCAIIASGTVDMPTASAPNTLNALISAGDSNAGPFMYAYTPSLTTPECFCMIFASLIFNSLSNVVVTSGNLSPNWEILGPLNADSAKKLK